MLSLRSRDVLLEFSVQIKQSVGYASRIVFKFCDNKNFHPHGGQRFPANFMQLQTAFRILLTASKAEWKIQQFNGNWTSIEIETKKKSFNLRNLERMSHHLILSEKKIVIKKRVQCWSGKTAIIPLGECGAFGRFNFWIEFHRATESEQFMLVYVLLGSEY